MVEAQEAVAPVPSQEQDGLGDSWGLRCGAMSGLDAGRRHRRIVCDPRRLDDGQPQFQERVRQERTLCKSSSSEHSQVSVPNNVADAPFVDELAPAKVEECLKGHRIHMLRPPEVVRELNAAHGEPARRMDPALLRKPLSSRKFVRCMHSIHTDISMPVGTVLRFRKR